MVVLRASRLALGLVLWALLSGGLVTAQGFFDEGGPGGAPERFGTEHSRVGDAGLYKTALVIVDGATGDAEWVDMEARYAFERTADRFVLDRHGEPRWARSFVAEWKTEPFEVDLTRFFAVPEFPQLPGSPTDPGCGSYAGDPDAFGDCWDDYADDWEDWGEEMDEETWATYDWEAFSRQWTDWAAQWEGYDDEWLSFGAPLHRVQETPWHVSHHDADSTGFAATHRPGETPTPDGLDLSGLADPTWTAPAAIDGPCGYRHSLQGARAPIWDTVVVHGACPPPVSLGFGASELLSGPIEMRVSGTDTVGAWDTTVYGWAEDADRLRLWFAKDVAYPVRILDRLPEVVPPEVQAMVGPDVEQPTLYVMHELIEYAPGTGPSGDEPAVGVLPPATAPRRAWGPDDAGVPLHWPLHRAYSAAAGDALAGWLRDHPDAAVVAAELTVTERPDPDPDHDEPLRDETWTFTVADDTAARLVTSTLHGRTVTAELGGQVRTWREHSVRTHATAVDSRDLPGPDDLPDRLPSATGQLRRYALAAGHPATGYGFDLAAGTFWVHDGAGPAARTLWLDERGRPEAFVVGDSTEPRPQFQAAEWSPYADSPWTRTAAERGVWQWPEPKTAAALAGAAAGATLLAFALAALKAGSGIGLFSRIAKADLLEHPVRSDIMAHVSTDPGIHFQELVRRVGKGRGTTEHHVRKLVQSDLLSEHTDKGFTCYFPKGAVDRRVMAAAPLLKSDGARMVLHAVVAVPGSVARDLAAELGMAPSTVNYHLRKLQDAGLVDGTRQGRFLALVATETGRKALGTFGAPASASASPSASAAASALTA